MAVGLLAEVAGATRIKSLCAYPERTGLPSTVYAAYNAYKGEKRMAVYPYNDHEGGGVPPG